MEPIKRLFSSVPLPAHSAGLFSSVMAAVSQAHALRNRARWYAAAMGVSALAVVPTAYLAYQNVAQSGAGTLFGLLITDFDAVAASWRQYALSLLESIPLYEVAATAALAALFFWFAGKAAETLSPAPAYRRH